MNKEILKRIINNAYVSGYSDGNNEYYNQEVVGEDISMSLPVDGVTKTTNDMLNDFLILTEDDMIEIAKGIDIELVSIHHFTDRQAILRSQYVEFQNSRGETKVLKNRYPF